MIRRTMALALAALLAAILVSCAEQGAKHDEPASAAEPADAAETAEAVPAALEMTAEMQSKLAAADRVDGEEDGVVSKCPGCSLAMDGNAGHTLSVGDYELHFCSDGCKERFEGDVAASLMALAVPEE